MMFMIGLFWCYFFILVVYMIFYKFIMILVIVLEFFFVGDFSFLCLGYEEIN